MSNHICPLCRRRHMDRGSVGLICARCALAPEMAADIFEAYESGSVGELRGIVEQLRAIKEAADEIRH